MRRTTLLVVAGAATAAVAVPTAVSVNAQGLDASTNNEAPSANRTAREHTLPVDRAKAPVARKKARSAAPVTGDEKKKEPEIDRSVDIGPSQWKGRALRHPSGAKFDPQVLRWANVTVKVMDELKIPRKYLPGILAQMQQESDGDPKAVNNWDGNAAAGTPSKGLLQVIAPTYRDHAKAGYTALKYQTVPYTNIYAALRYVKAAYGMGKFSSWNGGANHGY
jgi:Transglycosylase SLT domain